MSRLKSLQFFLYRRLAGAGVLAARFKKDKTEIWLSDKFQVASFQDVFLDPNYWRVFTALEKPPELVVDCGAHCGHFAILAELCIVARFGASQARYVLVEPNDALLPALRGNIAAAGMADRVRILRGFVGTKSGEAHLATHPSNHLVGRAQEGGSGPAIPYLDLAAITDGAAIDLLKLDIEGAEFQFAASNRDVLDKTDLVVAEVHPHTGSVETFQALLAQSDLLVDGPVVTAGENFVAWFKRRAPITV